MRHALLFGCMILVLALAACSDKGTEVELTEAPYVETFSEAKALAADGDKPILIKFYADWCHWCHVLDTVVLVDSQAINFFRDEVVLFKTNADIDTALKADYNISGLPTCVLVDKDGNEIDRVIGYAPTEEWLGMIQGYMRGEGTLDDLLGQAETNEDRDLFFQIAEKYKYRGMPEEAETWYGKVIDAGEPTDSVSAESRMAIADMYRRADDHDKALAAFQAIKKDFKSMGDYAMNACVYIGLVELAKGDSTAALKTFENFVKDYPETDASEFVQGQIDMIKNPPAAEEH